MLQNTNIEVVQAWRAWYFSPRYKKNKSSCTLEFLEPKLLFTVTSTYVSCMEVEIMHGLKNYACSIDGMVDVCMDACMEW